MSRSSRLEIRWNKLSRQRSGGCEDAATGKSLTCRLAWLDQGERGGEEVGAKPELCDGGPCGPQQRPGILFCAQWEAVGEPSTGEGHGLIDISKDHSYCRERRESGALTKMKHVVKKNVMPTTGRARFPFIFPLEMKCGGHRKCF